MLFFILALLLPPRSLLARFPLPRGLPELVVVPLVGLVVVLPLLLPPPLGIPVAVEEDVPLALIALVDRERGVARRRRRTRRRVAWACRLLGLFFFFTNGIRRILARRRRRRPFRRRALVVVLVIEEGENGPPLPPPPPAVPP